MKRFSWRAFIFGNVIYIILMPLAFFITVFGSLSAFSPNYRSSSEAPILGYVLFAGTYLSRALMDATIFGGPMPPQPSNGLTGAQREADPGLGRQWDIYTAERLKRRAFYDVSWMASPLFIGTLAGFLWPLFRRSAKALGTGIVKEVPPEQW